ncbi:CPBP family intramembrane metalloprotease [Natronococcus sp. JC468]|uniref:CPBP family intramembrane glutamic endopeptidase n=1 Tax=Natronococcus sp. JC468 TaxID=1961921 RepID=UPI001439C111|nr:CPBP family intramembrane glutamic endopeptidase [Natronococcus sp. JC468]NKE37951.1 CPBP family intramembrane metalloprotease [Natronococcus sp. JC468]
MAAWTAFAAITGAVLLVLLVLSHLTQSAFDGVDLETDTADESNRESLEAESVSERGREAESEPDREPAASNAAPRSEPAATDRRGVGPDGTAAFDATERVEEPDRRRRSRARRGAGVDPDSLTAGAVLANVAASQGLFALVLLGAVVYTGVPADALGIEFSRTSLETGLVVGTGVGTVLYVADELGAALATRLGFDHDERLRKLLAPGSAREWVVLLGGVLPIIAVFEELLFRAALIGALSVGFGVSPWLLAVASSIAFALGHGMQGVIGVVVTGALGFVLAAVFIVTESFLVVVVAHYLINALEFVVHEAIELEWARTIES